MLKEYTLKVTVRVGGDEVDDCEEAIQLWIDERSVADGSTYEITHEEVLEPLYKASLVLNPPTPPQPEKEDV